MMFFFFSCWWVYFTTSPTGYFVLWRDVSWRAYHQIFVLKLY